MVKNYLLYLIFSTLLLAASATACLAGQDSVVSQHEQNANQPPNSYCCPNPDEDRQVKSKDSFMVLPAKKDSQEDEVKEVTPSILNSNFILYILFKFKFVDNRGSHYNNEVEENRNIPILSYTRSIYIAINSLFEKKF